MSPQKALLLDSSILWNKLVDESSSIGYAVEMDFLAADSILFYAFSRRERRTLFGKEFEPDDELIRESCGFFLPESLKIATAEHRGRYIRRHRWAIVRKLREELEFHCTCSFISPNQPKIFSLIRIWRRKKRYPERYVNY